MNGTTRARRARRGRAAVVLVATLTAALCSACGVRTTSVPVDAGAAPSRMPCAVGAKDPDANADPGTVPVRVYLVCASELTPVERAVHMPRRDTADARVRIAQALLDSLQARPSAAEHQAGFTTYVQPPLQATAGRSGDPAATLRLSAQPEDLPGTALAQIVCTFAEGGAARGEKGRVVLGGPGPYAPRAYTCDASVKTDPDAAVPATAATAG
ncbi:hypothetical protein [Streptomyces sp. NRRL F-5126]|uniref:hypothetical protein n=1 Tax=Streptomyces sp. NRRL F-5126 TaxID=1463857 RepID=UPI0004CBEFBC|nr:hypothetical protein [Streptomyces sp. NRRL F-5126]